jgi:L-fucose mutarotase
MSMAAATIETVEGEGEALTQRQHAVLDAVLTLMPLDDFVDQAAIGMAVVGEPDLRQPIYELFEDIILHHEPAMGFSTIERFAFYDRAKKAAAVIQTGEGRLYGNIILKKGIIRPNS